MDEFPATLRKRRVLVAGVACTIEFLLGLPMITEVCIHVVHVLKLIACCLASYTILEFHFGALV